MKRFLLVMLTALMALGASAKTDVDYSSRFAEGTNTIEATSSWGWHKVDLKGYEVAEAEYLYIKYEASCDFEFILQDPNWQTCYKVTCSKDATEGYLKLEPNKYPSYSCVVIQNHSEGSITVNKIYFCSEEEFYNPNPEGQDEARQNLVDTYVRYQAKLGDFPVGTDYGTYPEDLFKAFEDAVNAALIMDTPEGVNMTAEQYNALAQAIVDAYRALIAAKKLYSPADGYYRLVCARLFSNGNDDDGYHDSVKGMYSSNTGSLGWNTLKTDDPTFLWTITRQPNNDYLLTNAGNTLNFTSTDKCTDGIKYITIDPIAKVDGKYETIWPLSTEEDIVMFNFRFNDKAANTSKYIHMNWHDGGKGWNGPLTTWYNTTNDSGASEWYLQAVSDEEVQEILNANAYGHDFLVMLNDANEKADIANDMIREKLITEAGQFSSPYSQNDLGSKDGGNLAEGVLIDGDNGTFWHSVWSEGSVEKGSHYLQIELADAVSGDIEFVFSRRMTSSNHLTQWGIYGSNDPDGEKYDYEWITDLDTPYGEQGETIKRTFTIENGKTYKYLRFYCESQGYFHLSEMQLYALSENPNNQAAQLGKTYTDLVAALEVANAVDPNAVSKADYDALKAAYDPFIALFVDPTPLRDAINAAEPALNLVEIGKNPGQWAEGATAAIEKTIEDAKAYDKSGKYTQAETDAYVEALGDPSATIKAAANKVDPNKFYTIRFASEDKYEEQGWSTSNVISEEVGNLFDTYLTVAKAETLEPLSADDVRQGNNLFFTENADADIAFRFVPVGEGTYTIQHAATGLYIQVYGYDSWTGLTLNPSICTVEAAGYGEVLMHATDYAGKDLSNLHAQLRDHRLVTWHDTKAGTNSCLIIEEVEYDGEVGSPLADYQAGEITTMCYPVAVAASAGKMYTVAGTYQANDKVYVALNEVQAAEAGQPVVYIAEGTYEESEEPVLNTVTLTVGTEIALEPNNTGALYGTYTDLALEEEAIIFTGKGCDVSTEETSTVYAHRAYIGGTAKADAAGTYSLVLEVGGDITGLGNTLAEVNKAGTIYNAAGQVVRRNSTLSDIQSLGRGLYILNGVKVLVK